jgi:hypothetical protein
VPQHSSEMQSLLVWMAPEQPLPDLPMQTVSVLHAPGPVAIRTSPVAKTRRLVLPAVLERMARKSERPSTLLVSAVPLTSVQRVS